MSLAPGLLLSMLCLAATDEPRPSRPREISLRHDPASAAGKSAVIVLGIDPKNLETLATADWTPDRWSEMLSVSVVSKKDQPISIAGTYRILGDALRFEPKYEFEPGLRHVARFDPSRLPIAGAGGAKRIEFAWPSRPKGAPTFVARMEPSGDVLPENLLKVYLHFSAPMSRGEVYQRVRLTDASGRKIDSAFLELGEELWDTSGMRITLLLDPGRIKRGLRPREEEGPILEAGKTYALQVDREWPDADGQPLREPFKKVFRAGPADMQQPDPKLWKIGTPVASSRDPLDVAFPEPLDRAMLDRALVLYDPAGKRVSGRVSITAGSTRWRFTPDREWSTGTYQLEIDPELEDLAGNSIARPFEVDIEGPVEAKETVRRVKLPITISAARRP